MTSLQAINGPLATPPVYSLLIAATTPATSPDRWQDGVQWAPEQFGDAEALCVDCGSTDTMDLATEPITNRAQPILVAASDHCSTFGFLARDYEGRARRQLAATESKVIARELQLGEQRDDCTLVNVALHDGITVGAGLFSVIDAFALMEEKLAEAFSGRRCMIHVTPKVFTMAKAALIVELQGQRWVTGMGTIVAADAGYQTIAGVDWMYGTGPVTIIRSEVNVPGTFAQNVDHHLNKVAIYADRLALVLIDSAEAAAADHIFKIEVEAPFGAGS